MQPPARFADATLDTYEAAAPSQQQARAAVRRFVRDLRERPSPLRRLKLRAGLSTAPPRPGLYLVGPVGTGKTHLLAAAWHALTPRVPAAFLHSSELFRQQARPAAFAERVARDYRVFCLDEVELDDAANEARLVAVLRGLEERGVTLLATSNVAPDNFLAGHFGSDRFERFLRETTGQRYEVVPVGGDDYRRRLTSPGKAWIGPGADEALRTAYERQAGGSAPTEDGCWLPFGELLEAATHTAHDALMDRLLACERLYLAGVAIGGTDDALRLLRIVDDLYTNPQAPILFLSAAEPPAAWFRAQSARAGIERGVAEKFERTTSRVHALCRVVETEATTPPAA